MNKKQVIDVLRAVGFPVTNDLTMKQFHEVVTDFQRGFTFGRPLVQDGFFGPKTEEALLLCAKKGGRISPNFKWLEFASKGQTDYTIKVAGFLVLGLEEVRLHVGPFGILSGYRDPAHNHGPGGVGSTPNSQHLYGNAVDPTKKIELAVILGVKRFSGIGTDKTLTGLVRHMDCRHLGPNTTGSSIERPARWIYA